MSKAGKPYSRPALRGRSDGEWLHDKAPGVPRSVAASVNNTINTAPSTKIVVSNLHYELTTKDLTQIFGQVGTLVREPLIRYDRSGRSSGVAIISLETSAEATAAIQRFNGKLAKGQAMSIEYHHPPVSQSRTARKPVGASSLLHRIEKAPLLERLENPAFADIPKYTTRLLAVPSSKPSRPGSVRTAKPRGTPRAPKKPKTAEELDDELDRYLKEDTVQSKPVSASAPPAVQADGDVEMA